MGSIKNIQSQPPPKLTDKKICNLPGKL